MLNRLVWFQTQSFLAVFTPCLQGGGLALFSRISTLALALSFSFCMIFSFLIVPNRLNGQNCDCSVYPNYKCIVSGTLQDLIASGDLLDYTEAQTEPQFIVVESDINFYDPNNTQPYKFAPGSAIFMLAGSGLAIRKEVVFSGTSLFGCTERWNGITVFNGGTLRMVEGSNIANTCLAIELKPYSKAEIVSATFANNRVCIEATGEVQTIGAGIAHNTFDRGGFQFNCSATLERGIILRNVPQITIGNISGGGTPNKFIGYNGGITAENTNLDVFNSTFENNSNGTGVVLEGTGGTYSANITGLGNTVSDLALIKNLGNGISAQNYNLTVRNAYFNGINLYHIKMVDSHLPTRLVVSNNRFDQFQSHAIFVSGSTLQNTLIAENEFRDDNSDELEKTCIRWTNTQLASPAAIGNIRQNHFYDDPKTSPDPLFLQFTSIGIYVNGASQLRINDNSLYQAYNSDIDHRYFGIQLNNAAENELIDNVVIGNYGPLTTTNPGFSYRGIQLRESPRCFLSCNQSQSLNEGIAFHGPACDKTNFLQNIMSDNLTGLYLAPGTIIGRQKDRENKWYGDLPAGGVAEANFDGMPGPLMLSVSRFFINSTNPGSSFWATPRIPAGGWFDFSDNEVGLLYTCLQEAEPYPPKSEAEGMLIGGGFENYKGYPASGWELALSAFGTLDEHPELRPENSPEASFYNTHLSGNVGKLSRARASWDIITRFSASLEANWATNAAETDQKLEEIQAENLAMEQAGTAAEQAQIVQTLEGLKTELETLLQTNQSLSAQYESDIADRANDLATDLATINASEVWESNLKTVLELSVAKLISGNGEWTSSQFTSLESIANQCRYEGGIGVVLARSAIDKFDFDDEAMCPGWVEERTNQSIVLNAKISPNPANTQCRIFFEQAVNGTLYVRNMQGQTVQSLTLSERSALILNTEKWPAGLYTVSVFADSGARFSAKVAISH